jgi:hypothetical protein
MKEHILQAVTEHIVLPPKLPQKAPGDDVEMAIEAAICSLAAESSATFAAEELAASSLLRRLTAAILRLGEGVKSPRLNQADVLQQLQEMSTSGTISTHETMGIA